MDRDTPENSQEALRDLAGGGKRVAVIGVHGVADHRPAQTARLVADALQSPHAGAGRYRSFDETNLQIGVDPVCMADLEHCPTDDADGHFDDPCLEVTREQLLGYSPTPEDRVYHTVRLSGQRLVEDQAAGDVHLYELYWTDLSRLGAGWLSIIWGFYRTMSHVSRLGRRARDYAFGAAPECRHAPRRPAGNGLWRICYWLHEFADDLIGCWIPILNLFLLAVLLLAAPAKGATIIGSAAAQAAAVALPGLATLVALVVAAWRYQLWRGDLRGMLGALGISALGSASAYALLQSWQVSHRLAAEWLALAGGVLAWIVFQFNEFRKEAAGAGLFVGAVSLVVVVHALEPGALPANCPWDSEGAIAVAAAHAAEILLLALFAAWGMLHFLVVSLTALGKLAVWWEGSPRGGDDDRAYQTVVMSLVIPSALTGFGTLYLYGGLIFLSLNPWLRPPEVTFTPWFPFLSRPGPQTFEQFSSALFAQSASPGFVISLGCCLAALLLVGWGLMPAIWAEFQQPARPRESTASNWLGRWLTTGLGWIWPATLLIVLGVHVAIPCCLSLARLSDEIVEALPWLRPVAAMVVEDVENVSAKIPHLLVIFGGTGILALFGPQGAVLTGGLRTALGIVLDVDNYFQSHPRDRNPRSRICARYASLLRYLCAWRDPRDGRPYDAIVIVAHSLGTVISADLLRFLKANPDPALARIFDQGKLSGAPPLPVYMLTMGSPLRQLFHWRFPHLYGWLGQSLAALGERPWPAELNLAGWINVYRSGDYVGRHLWQDEISHPVWEPTTLDAPNYEQNTAGGARSEQCFGAGAHSFYYDQTADLVGAVVDQLVGRVGSGGPAPAASDPPTTAIPITPTSHPPAPHFGLDLATAATAAWNWPRKNAKSAKGESFNSR